MWDYLAIVRDRPAFWRWNLYEEDASRTGIVIAELLPMSGRTKITADPRLVRFSSELEHRSKCSKATRVLAVVGQRRCATNTPSYRSHSPVNDHTHPKVFVA